MNASDDADAEPTWTVGQLAELAGLTVRTLQFYDRTGLLPARRDPAGRRRYGSAELSRLQRIQLLTGAGFQLQQVGAQLDEHPDRPLAEIYAAQVELLELQELRLRCRRTVLGAVAEVVAEHPDVEVPASVLAALMSLDQTLLRYPELDLPAPRTAPTEPTVQRVLNIYFAWKAAAVAALILVANRVEPGGSSGRRLWQTYQAELDRLLGTDAELSRMHTDQAERSMTWPEHDRDLHIATKDYLDRCQRLHATPGPGPAARRGEDPIR